ncbi:uncharacterized protein LOC117505365 [Thalassophryne amazonica]|uniref:uncharacterized protein LOC117505365 n=1 Tax=Thalassophryne amazonica TaxID=390379 RepID=UPI001471FBA5|nr:uncharacterized protein LOC117505365 [Thalassophryne amazonica]
MGGADRCAVYKCKNDRRYKDRLVIKDHVHELKWHSCPVKWRPLWLRLINRSDLKVLSDHTRVCSNHFFLGRPSGVNPHPSMYLKGYEGKPSHMENVDVQELMKNMNFEEATEADYGKTRQAQLKRKPEPNRTTRRKETVVALAEHDYVAVPSTSQMGTSHLGETLGYVLDDEVPSSHDETVTASYCVKDIQEEHAYDCTTKSFCDTNIDKLSEEREAALQTQKELFDKQIASSSQGVSQQLHGKYSIKSVEHSDALMLFHSGVNNCGVFQYICELAETKVAHINCERT